MAVTRQRFEVFRFPVMQSTFCFSNVAIIKIPAASLINYFRPEGAVESVFIGEKIGSRIVAEQGVVKAKGSWVTLNTPVQKISVLPANTHLFVIFITPGGVKCS